MREQFEYEVAYSRFSRASIVAMIFWIIESLAITPGSIIEMIGEVVPMLNVLLNVLVYGGGSVGIIFVICQIYDLYLDKNERA